MKMKIKNFRENPVSFFRRLGYVFVRCEEGDMSFVRALAKSGYPRFHIYAHMREGDLIINIHLDQKKKTYGSATRHHGEYKNDGVLRKESERINNLLK